MVEQEESLADIETLWWESVKTNNKKSEEVENIIHKKVEKYVTEEGFPNKGINKEDIIREMENTFLEKTMAPVIEQREITSGSFDTFFKNNKALELHHKGAKVEAEGLSTSKLKKMYDEITAKEKRRKK